MSEPTVIDERAIRRYRLERVRAGLIERALPAILVVDPVNLRYATGTRNMQVWTMHNICRYAFIPAEGPVVLFELGACAHLARDIETVDEIRPSFAFDYMMVGERVEELAARWAADLDDLLRAAGGADRRLAIDRADLPAIHALEALGITAVDGKPLMERARAIKSAEEIEAFRFSLASCDAAVAALRERVHPGMRESEALAELIAESVRRGGEYPETRLLTSGPRTNPWFQETSDRVIEDGELLSFDTDLIGPMGFYNDISRTWVIGDRKPTDTQRRLYGVSRAQLEHNVALLRPGVGFLEYADRSYALPGEFVPNRYADVAHGCGLGVEYPLILYREDAEFGAYDGVFEAEMIVCVESYIGAVDGREGVKLEQPVLLSESGPELLSASPLEDGYG